MDSDRQRPGDGATATAPLLLPRRARRPRPPGRRRPGARPAPAAPQRRDRKVAGVAGGLGPTPRHRPDRGPGAARGALLLRRRRLPAVRRAAGCCCPTRAPAAGGRPDRRETRKWLLYGVVAVAVLIALGRRLGRARLRPVGAAGLLVCSAWCSWSGASPGVTRPAEPAPTPGTSPAAADRTASGAAAAPRATLGTPAVRVPRRDAAARRRRPAGPARRRPRRTGTGCSFWPTLALIAVGLGALGVYDAGHAVEPGGVPGARPGRHRAGAGRRRLPGPPRRPGAARRRRRRRPGGRARRRRLPRATASHLRPAHRRRGAPGVRRSTPASWC